MPAALHAVRAGVGPPALLIHGSGADHTTWSLQLATLRDHFAMIAYDRRGAGSVEEHAADAAALVEGMARPLLIGSSFGAVIALELLRAQRGRFAGAVLIEPPLAVDDEAPAPSVAFFAEFDRRAATLGGPAAAEFFLRLVLGDATYELIPAPFQNRAKAKWAAIRADGVAAIAYRPRYAELRRLDAPVLLVGGGRSTLFLPALEALRATLPAARLAIIAGAGHLLQIEAPHQFADLVLAFAATVAGATARQS